MLPIRDVIPSRTTPFVTMALIAINVAVFLAMPGSDTPEYEPFLRAWGLTPAAFTWPAVVTAMFVHAGFGHLFSNMLFLWIFGDNVEDRVGHLRFLVFYGLCGLAAALLQVGIERGSTVPMVGASGAIAGVLGAYLIMFPQSRVLTFVFVTFLEVPASLLLGLWFATQLLSGIGALAVVRPEDMGGVAFWAHAGGFAAGASLVLLFRRPERMRVEWWDQVAG
ncbi:rhomboid family intramembrane serine protease [Luteitalea sp. TBR-22]|uniref:rhomboid family intramembrane serine protease n=1 Tax=Luteitalea sp. TBR-22 TaxID=2802971 RepID=UPI001EF62875|nr:rhomboid family intramembrane serine protease [Luteitalea sp. TBR-22]